MLTKMLVKLQASQRQLLDQWLVDNGAPYSAIGQIELRTAMSIIEPGNEHTILDPIPEAFRDRPFWQYGAGKHSSDIRPIIGSVLVNIYAGKNVIIKVRHLVLSGSSQWVFGRNITSKSNIMQLNNAGMVIPGPDSERIRLPIIEHDMHIYLPLSLFINPRQPDIVQVLSGMAVDASPAALNKILNRVHTHVCGHATYSDIKTLLQRNNIWSDQAESQLQTMVATCTNCRAMSKPQPSRKVSLSSLSREFNEVTCIDHFFFTGSQ